MPEKKINIPNVSLGGKLPKDKGEGDSRPVSRVNGTVPARILTTGEALSNGLTVKNTALCTP
ncbi:hypothetical protein [Bacillus sp. T33-2]|uniref:hypothetical protein n=1 Tax=Bacillus sp. T33-2 TaxID=2054168 RepID=UPI000C78AD2C|nr:hypothetical protein [Bacillus sp. T33-2]PLR97527.1 hypothetical protein CVD19_08570 [Bacillus sp. T33-2]